MNAVMKTRTRHRLIACLALCGALIAGHPFAFAADPPPPGGGIWKAVVPPKAMHGEFGNEDPVGLAAGKHIRADCSLNWVADDGKLYCFTTGTSLLFFEESPSSYIRQARGFYEHNPPPAS
jgi:hypothetical protein